MGRDVNGPTATVKSVASMVDGDLHEGALYNLRFDPHGVQGEKGLNILEGVIKTYFNDGGQHIQINVVDNETLKKAQIHPENYRGLMVRVAGYMAYFTELDKQPRMPLSTGGRIWQPQVTIRKNRGLVRDCEKPDDFFPMERTSRKNKKKEQQRRQRGTKCRD